MSDRSKANHPSELRHALQELTKGAGARRGDLLEALEGELRPLQACWSVNLNNGLHVAQRTIAVNLRAHITNLKVRPGRQELSLRDRRQQYEHAIKTCFNIDVRAELNGTNLTQRQAWLAEDARGPLKIDQSTCRRDLRDALDQIEQQILDSGYTPLQTEALYEPEQILIDRYEYLTRLHGHLNAGHQIICIWGEPGTGKTTLARQLTARLDGTAPVLTIRMPPTLEALTAESLIFRQDLIEALIAEGLDPTNWSLEYTLSRFRARVGDEPRAKAIIIDNVALEESIWQLVPIRPKVPVIITMHSRPQNEHIACEELYGFTEAQACEFIDHHLPDQDAQESTVLARLLGYRPLVLEQAVLFVKRSPDITLRTLSDSLAQNVTDTLVTVTPPEQWERNISSLYERILASLVEYRPGQVLLDAFLAIAGQSGTTFRELVYAFMQSDQGGSLNRPYFRAGLQELSRRGLLQEQTPLRNAPGFSDSRPSTVELSMHPLTYRILRSLREEISIEIEVNYLKFLSATESLPSLDELADEGLTHAYINQKSIGLAQGGLPDGWLSFHIVDSRTYSAIRKSSGGASTHGPYTVRYVLQEDGLLYKFDYHTRQWSTCTDREWQELNLILRVYNERSDSWFTVSATGEVFPYTSEVQIYREVTPADGYVHSLIGPIPVSYCVEHSISVWSRCGKRFVPTSIMDKGSCPDCQRTIDSAERLGEIELTLKGAFAQLSIKEPLEAAWLFLIRADLRRSLKRLNEAAQDLLAAFDFLWEATEASQYERLAIGAGIARLADKLPNIDPHWLLSMAVRIKDTVSWVDSEVIYLYYSQARSMDKLGLVSNALVQLDTVVAIVDSGGVDRSDMNVDLGRILYEKEEIERKLGKIDEANATMRRLISESEQRDDGGKALAATLFLSANYLCSENPEQARKELLRAIQVAQQQRPIDNNLIWNCMMLFAQVVEGQGETTLALNMAEAALRLANEYLSEHTDVQERSLQAINRIKGALPDDTS